MSQSMFSLPPHSLPHCSQSTPKYKGGAGSPAAAAAASVTAAAAASAAKKRSHCGAARRGGGGGDAAQSIKPYKSQGHITTARSFVHRSPPAATASCHADGLSFSTRIDSFGTLLGEIEIILESFLHLNSVFAWGKVTWFFVYHIALSYGPLSLSIRGRRRHLSVVRCGDCFADID